MESNENINTEDECGFADLLQKLNYRAKTGWYCPKCGAVISPDKDYCPFCVPAPKVTCGFNPPSNWCGKIPVE